MTVWLIEKFVATCSSCSGVPVNQKCIVSLVGNDPAPSGHFAESYILLLKIEY